MANYNSVEELFAAGTANMTVHVDNAAYDDNTYQLLGASWLKFNGETVPYIYASGNTWIGFGSMTEHLKVNRRDAKMWYLYKEEGTLYNYYRFIKIRWQGYSYYSQTSAAYSLIYDVVLWDTGHISLHMVNIPTSNYDGTFSLTASTTTFYSNPTAGSPDVTFTPTNQDNSKYTASHKVIELELPYDRKYLIRSGSAIYTVADGALSEILGADLDVSLMQTYGVDEMPAGQLLVGLTDPEIIYWQDSDDDLPQLRITVKGAPPAPQVVTSTEQDLTHETIAGIDYAFATASDDVLFAITFDGGTTWLAHDGGAWYTVSDTAVGMPTSRLVSITREQWAEVAVLQSCRIRYWLPNPTAYVTVVGLRFINL